MKKAFLQLHIAILLAGVTGILGRLITVNEGVLVFCRMLITVAILWGIHFFSKKIKQEKIPVRSIWQMMGVGCVVALHWLTFYGGIKYANVSVALVAFSSIGFFSALIEPVVLRKRMDFTELFLGLLAIAGIAMIFHFEGQYQKGIIFSVVSAFLGALFTVLNKKIVDQKFESELVTRYEMSAGLLVICAVLPFYFSTFGLSWQSPTPGDWLWLIILSWLCTVWAFGLTLRALKKISPFTINLSFNLEPVYGILLAFLIFQENRELNKSFYIGLSLILLAIVLQMLRVIKISSFRRK